MEKKEEILQKLSQVYDPELDQSVTEMGFIEDIFMDGTDVTIYFRLPTYWCSPNFAYIMAEDMRDRVLEIPWVSSVEIALKDHCAAEQVNQGVTQGKTFSEVFSDLSGGNLEELRQKFRVKTFLSRQEYLMRHLLGTQMTHAEMAAASLGEVEQWPLLGTEGKHLLERYRKIRRELGHSCDPDQRAFIKADGSLIEPEQFSAYLLEARRTRLSMEFNAHYCRGLLETRYAVEMGPLQGGKQS